MYPVVFKFLVGSPYDVAKGPSKKRERASRFLVHFFDVYCTTTTWNPLMQRFVEDVDIRRQIFLSLLEHG